jgi:DnaJ-class molecular chaperone
MLRSAVALLVVCASICAAPTLAPIETLQRCESPEALRKAFRALALELHPDKAAPSDAEAAAELFALVRAAYETLLTAFETAEAGTAGGAAGSAWADQMRRSCGRTARRLDMSGAGAFRSGSAAGYAFHVGYSSAGAPGPGKTIEPVVLTLSQAIRGVELPFAPRRVKSCAECSSAGHVHPAAALPSEPCRICDGRGVRLRPRNLGDAFDIEGPAEGEGRRSSAPINAESLDDVVQHTCEGCCGTGREVHVCPACNGTGFIATPVPGTLSVPPGLKDGAEVPIDGMFESHASESADSYQGAEDAADKCGAPGGGEEASKCKILWEPSHVRIAYNTSWESARGFSVHYPLIVKVGHTTLARYCRTRNARVTLPTGDMHILSLGPSSHLDAREEGGGWGGGRKAEKGGKEGATASPRARGKRATDDGGTGNGTTAAKPARKKESVRSGRHLAGVQTLRLPGQGLPNRKNDGMIGIGDAVVLLRLSFPDRLGAAEVELLRGCFGGSERAVGLVRGTAALLASLKASLVEDGWAVHAAAMSVGMEVACSATDPLITLVTRRAWYGAGS